jgi:hypothetical protein
MVLTNAMYGVTEFGDVIVQAGLAVRHRKDSLLNKQSVRVIASDVCVVLGPDALLVSESEVSAASYGGHRCASWCLQGVDSDVLGAARTQSEIGIQPDYGVRGNALEAEHIYGLARIPAGGGIAAVNGSTGGLNGTILRASDVPPAGTGSAASHGGGSSGSISAKSVT